MGLLDELLRDQPRKRNLLMQGTSPTVGGQLTPMLRGDGESFLRQQYPSIYGALGGLLGVEPTAMDGSILDPNTALVREGASYGYPAGLAAQVLPVVGPAAKLTGRGVMAAGRAGERLAERVVPQIMERGGLPAEMLQGMSRGTVSPLDVYHGSPHLFPPTARNPLGEFDASKIGTGEGAQAYGHGIYLAESPAVAKGYMSTLGGNLDSKSAGYYPKINGKVVYDDFADLDVVRKIAAETDFKRGGLMGLGKRQSISSDDAIANLIKKNKLIADDPVYYLEAREEALKEIQDLLKYLGKNIEPSKPTVYKVDLPDKMIPKMLDYDRQLSEQSVEVQKILLPYQKEIGGSFGTGEQTLKAIAFERRMKGLDDSPIAVARQLKEMGIPGIRYFDAQSRLTPNITNSRLAELYTKNDGNAEAAVNEFMRSVYNTPNKKAEMRKQFLKELETPKTRNFVIFPGEEKNLRILERNGLLGD